MYKNSREQTEKQPTIEFIFSVRNHPEEYFLNVSDSDLVRFNNRYERLI